MNRSRKFMQRKTSVYEVTGVKFNGFDKETLQPLVENVSYDLENVRVKTGKEEESLLNALQRKIGKREADKFNLRSYRLKKDIIQTLDDELFNQYATTKVIEYDETGKEIEQAATDAE